MKFLVVDTNVWLLEPNFYEVYKNDVIVIPQTVIEEIDTKKGCYGNLGINARKASKVIDLIANKYQESVNVDYVEVEINEEMYKFKLSDLYMFGDKFDVSSIPLDLNINDNKIIANAIMLTSWVKEDVEVISNDCNVRCKVGLLFNKFKVKASLFEEGKVENINEYYSMCSPNIDDSSLSKLYEGKLKCKDLKIKDFHVNMPLYLNYNGEEILAYVSRDSSIIPIESENKTKKRCNVYKIKTIEPINRGQKQLVRAIKDNNIKIVSCFGKSGSGKSIISLATALQEQSEGKYAKIHLVKAYQPVGNSVGMLKGTLEDKVKPIKASFEDSLEVIGSMDLDKMEQLGVMSFSTPEFERGRTRHSSLVIVDEAQNMTPLEVKMLITRCGESSKIILLGDLRQVDNDYLTESFNGLAHATDRLTGQDFFSVIYLDKSERADFLNTVDDLL